MYMPPALILGKQLAYCSHLMIKQMALWQSGNTKTNMYFLSELVQDFPSKHLFILFYFLAVPQARGILAP